MPSSGVQTCARSEEHTSELQSHDNLVCRLLLEKRMSFATGPATLPRPLCRTPRPAPTGAARVGVCRPPGVPISTLVGGHVCTFFFFFEAPRPRGFSPLPPPPLLPP